MATDRVGAVAADHPRFVVQPLDPSSDQSEYDAVFATVGYETRSSFVLSQLAGRAAELSVSAYDTRKGPTYEENLARARDLGASPIEESDTRFVSNLPGRMNELFDRHEYPQIAVDISSSSRTRLAAFISFLLSAERSIVADFYYARAEFQPPSAYAAALAYSGPVSGDFVGRGGPETLPVHAVMGLGYEAVQALGAFQLLEASDAWLFVPVDPEDSYSAQTESVNRPLINVVKPGHIVRYEILDPYDLFITLERTVASLLTSARPVLVPLGPKVFALASLLVSGRFRRRIPVWRFSVDQHGKPLDVAARGDLCGLRLRIDLGDL